MNLFRLLYTSRATGPQDYAGLVSLLTRSQERNEQEGITGILCYADGYFFQCLEGPQSAVGRTMERIYRDPRHGGIVLVEARAVIGRMFSEWAMRFVEAQDLPADLVRFRAAAGAAGGRGHLDADRLLVFLAQAAAASQDPPRAFQPTLLTSESTGDHHGPGST